MSSHRPAPAAGSQERAGRDFDVDAVGVRVEQLLDEIAAVGGTAAAQGCEELVAELLGLYGAGLGRILQLLGTTVADPDAVLRALADDDLVAGLLVLHDLHPVDERQRVEAALDDVRPVLASHGGDVSIVDVGGDVVRLRLHASAGGCGSSQSVLRQTVEDAVRRAAPEVARIEVDSAPSAPLSALIPAEALRMRPAGDAFGAAR